MDKPIVLVISSAVQRKLSNAVFDEGSIALLTQGLSEFVKTLRRHHVTAIVVDSEHTGTDALEVVLTTRDIDPHVPILVLGASLDAASVSALQECPGVRLLAEGERPQDLCHELARIVRTP